MSDSKNTVAEPSQSLAEQAFEAARHDTKREHATEIRNFEIATGAAATAAGAGVVAVEHMRKISEAIETRTEDAVGYYVAADSTPTTVDFTYQSYSQPDNARRENLDLSENGQLALTYSWLTEIGDENQKGIPVPALKAGDGLWDLAAHSHRLYADMVALAAGYWDIDLLAQEDQLST